jgi:hypothetical protein
MKEKRKLEEAKIMAAMHGIKLGDDSNKHPEDMTDEEKNETNKNAAMSIFGFAAGTVRKGKGG